MLYSKAVSVVHSFIQKTQCETINRIRCCSLSTEAQQSLKMPLPDRLYKRIELEVRGNDPAVLKSYGHFTTSAAEKLGVTVGRNFCPRKAEHYRLTLLKSVFIYKKHRVQYETRTYYRFIDLLRLTGSTADTILEYLQRNLPEGVAMKVTKVELLPLLDAVKVPPSTSTTSAQQKEL